MGIRTTEAKAVLEVVLDQPRANIISLHGRSVFSVPGSRHAPLDLPRYRGVFQDSPAIH